MTPKVEKKIKTLFVEEESQVFLAQALPSQTQVNPGHMPLELKLH